MDYYDELDAINFICNGAFNKMLLDAEKGEEVIYPHLGSKTGKDVYVMHFFREIQLGNYYFRFKEYDDIRSCFVYDVEKLRETPFGETTVDRMWNPE